MTGQAALSMPRLVPPTFPPRQLVYPLLATLLLAGSTPGCKPASPPAGGLGQPPLPEIAAPPPADAHHPPGTDELARFLRGKLPPSTLQLAELKNDPPVPLPGTSAGDHAWLYNVRVTFAPTEDVLGPPAPHHAAVFREAVDDLDELTAWSAAYARSPYAGRYPSLSVPPPAPTGSKLLAVLHAKDQPYPPLYGKLSAEWQVDHWHYALTELPTPADDGGKLRRQYQGPLLIQGSPEAQGFLASVAAAKTQRAAIEADYQADLRKATAPGTTYRGQLRYQDKTTPAEVRLTTPPAGADPQQEVQLEVRLSDAPAEAFVYLAKRAARLPLHLEPPATADAEPPASDEEEPTPAPVPLPALPQGDLTLSLVSSPGKGAYHDPVAAALLRVTRGFAPPTSVTLQVHDGRLEGRLNDYGSEQSRFVLSVQQSP